MLQLCNYFLTFIFMILYILLFILYFISIPVILYFIIKYKDKQIKLSNDLYVNTIKELNLEKKKDKTIKMWMIDKPNDKDFKLLESNKELISIIMKILAYEVFKKTDLTRSESNKDLNQMIWQLNQLHELYLIFYKINNWLFSYED